MQMNTYVLAKDHPVGIAMSDAVNIVENKRRRPIFFRLAGDEINLETVDVLSFTKSAYKGTIRHLHLTGVLLSKPVEVSEERGKELMDAYNKLLEDGGNLTGMSGSPVVVMLEPGLQVGVLNVDDPNQAMPNALPETPPISQTGSNAMSLDGGITVPHLDPAAPQSDDSGQPKKGKGAKKDPGTEQAEVVTSWKANRDLASQKALVAESSDKAFLQTVASTDESRQLQKIASARLAEIETAG